MRGHSDDGVPSRVPSVQERLDSLSPSLIHVDLDLDLLSMIDKSILSPSCSHGCIFFLSIFFKLIFLLPPFPGSGSSAAPSILLGEVETSAVPVLSFLSAIEGTPTTEGTPITLTLSPGGS